LPNLPKQCNCYNKIIVKWHPDAQQARLQVETRGLQIFNEDGRERLPNRWKWETLKVDDRSFFGGQQAPLPQSTQRRSFERGVDEESDKQRTAEYQRTRGNLPVVEVLPSLVPGQAYEARLWIVRHGAEYDGCYPTEVVWSAGSKFPVITVRRDDDPNFCATYNYWGPMLVQARLIFEDGTPELVHVYARMPTDYGSLRIEGTHAHA
jgi:hypothetical protein